MWVLSRSLSTPRSHEIAWARRETSVRSVFLVETDVFYYFSSMPKAKDKTSTVDSSPLEAGVAGAQRLSGSRNVVPTIDSARRPGDEFTGAAGGKATAQDGGSKAKGPRGQKAPSSTSNDRKMRVLEARFDKLESLLEKSLLGLNRAQSNCQGGDVDPASDDERREAENLSAYHADGHEVSEEDGELDAEGASDWSGPPAKIRRTETSVEDDVAELLKGDTAAGDSTAADGGDLLASFAKQLGVEEETGPDVNPELAKIIDKAMRLKVGDDNKKRAQEKTKLYPRPGNTDSLCVPRVNDLIWDKMKPTTRSRDAGLQAVQQTLVKGATAVIRVADSLLSKQPALATELSTLLDAVYLLGSTVSELNQKRRDFVRPDLNDRYRFIGSASVPVTSQLFGEDLAKQMHDISEANKMGSQLRAQQGAGWQPARGRGRGLSRARAPPYGVSRARPSTSWYRQGDHYSAGWRTPTQQGSGNGRGHPRQGQGKGMAYNNSYKQK